MFYEWMEMKGKGGCEGGVEMNYDGKGKMEMKGCKGKMEMTDGKGKGNGKGNVVKGKEDWPNHTWRWTYPCIDGYACKYFRKGVGKCRYSHIVRDDIR